MMNDKLAEGIAPPGSPVGTRINWGAIFAGSALALGFYLLFGSLGAAVGLSVSDRIRPTALHEAVVGWVIVSTAGAFLIGGLITTLLTSGENRVEAILHGIIMWALVIGAMVALGSAGIRGGFSAMMSVGSPHLQSGWESAAREAGVTPAEIERLGRSIQTDRSPLDGEELKAAARRVSWYVFAGIWGSMICAALGAWLGAGKTFRVIPGAVIHSSMATRTI